MESCGSETSGAAACGVGCVSMRSTVAKFCVATTAIRMDPVSQAPTKRIATDFIGGAGKLKEKIFPPRFFAASHQAHELPRGVQAERTRRTRQMHVRFVRQAIALAIVAMMAARHQILPRGIAPARA